MGLNIVNGALLWDANAHLSRKIYVLPVRGARKSVLTDIITFDSRKYVLSVIGERATRCVVAKLSQIPSVHQEVEDRLEFCDMKNQLIDHVVARETRVADIYSRQVFQSWVFLKKFFRLFDRVIQLLETLGWHDLFDEGVHGGILDIMPCRHLLPRAHKRLTKTRIQN